MSITLSGLIGNTYQGAQGIQGIQGGGGPGTQGTQGIQGGGGPGAQGTQGIQGLTGSGSQGLQGNTGIQGTRGGSTSTFPYKAETVSTSGQPDSGYLLWNNGTQTSATQINVFHVDDSGVDIDYYLSNLDVGQIIIIQARASSQDYQEFTISGSVTIVNPNTSNAYATIPVTNTGSGGVGASGFSNDALLELILSQAGAQGLQGVSGINGSQGIQGLQGPSGGGGGGGGITSTDDTSTNASFYPVMANAAGTTSNIIVTTTKLYFNPSTGNMSATQFNTLSDARVKDNIEIITDPFTILDGISGYKFNFIDTGMPSVGVLAQQVEKVLPELVATNPNGDKTVSYNGIIGVLIEAVKELKVKIEK